MGRVLDTRGGGGAESHTIIGFSPDHGDQLFEHGITGKNCFFEPSVRVPLMVSLPGRITPARYDELIETVDLLPTLFEFIGLLEPGATVVATEFPRALLADWGLPVSPDRAGEPVRAEMLYSRDGEPLAVRLLD